MHKTYLSRAMTRSMALDHPIGDPFGGPAYGERRDPITAVVSIATMAGTYAAAGTFAAMTLFQGLTFAGAALNLVGNITGNKTLSKIGMIAGIAGGVGSLAEASGLIDKTSSLGETFGFGDSAAAAPNTPLNNTPTNGGDSGNLQQTPKVDVNADTSNITTNTSVDASTAVNPTAANANSSLANSTAPGGYEQVNLASTPMPGEPGAGWNYFTDTGGNSVAISDNGTYFSNVGNNGMEQITGAGGQPMSAWDKFSNTMSTAGKGFLDMTKNNPMGAYLIAQAAGGVSDWLSGKTDAELEALKAQTGYADAKAMEVQMAIEKEKTRRANLNAGYQNVNASIGVNQNAQVNLPWSPNAGLISGARTA